MADRIPWDKYEAAILLEAFLEVKRNCISRREAIAIVSDQLRQMAINSGVAIDDIHRNKNGISFQMSSMESAWEGHTIQKSATRLFREIVEMYHGNQEQYLVLLKEAQDMATENVQPPKDRFITWLSTQVPSGQLVRIVGAYDEIESFCQKVKAIRSPLFEIDNYDDAVQVRRATMGNKAFRVTHGKQLALYESAVYYLCKYYKSGQHLASIEELPVDKINSFRDWLVTVENIAESTARSYSSSLSFADSYGIEHGLYVKSIFDSTEEEGRTALSALLNDGQLQELSRKRHNQITTAIKKWIKFQNAGLRIANRMREDLPGRAQARKHMPDYESVLTVYFAKGIRPESAIDLKRFRKSYTNVNGLDLTDSDDVIQKNLRCLCVSHEGKLFLPDAMLPQEIREKLFSFIDEELTSGKQALYYEAIFHTFSEEFLDYYIYDVSMLQDYMRHYLDGKYTFQSGYLTKEENATIDSKSEVATYIINRAEPVSVDELCVALAHIGKSKILQIVGESREFVTVGTATYVHVDTLGLTHEEIQMIANIITEALDKQMIVGGNELYEVLKIRIPRFWDERPWLNYYGLRDIVKYYLDKQFSFRGNIISRKDQEISMADVFADFAKSKRKFSLNELKTIAGELKSGRIYFETVYKNSLRISREEFISKDQAHFLVKETDAAIDRYCPGDYISLDDIEEFSSFPDAGFGWTPFLLEHYVYAYSDKYRLLHTDFNGDRCVGAIVKKSAPLKTFDDVIVRVLADSDIPLREKDALDLLVEKGFIARRRYANLKSILIQANAQRNGKGSN